MLFIFCAANSARAQNEGDAPANPRAGARPYPVKLKQPLAYGKDFIEVTEFNTLRRRYRVWGDWNKEVQAYLEEARDKARQRASPARKLKMGCVFLKDAQITCENVQGADGKPLTGVYSTPEARMQEARQKDARDFADFMFAFSQGEVEVEWTFETLEGLQWKENGKKPAWGCQPKAIGDQVEKALGKHKDSGIAMWVWQTGKPKTLNPAKDSNGKKLEIGSPPYGISYTQWPLYGAYNIVVCGNGVGLIVHELNHRYLDGLQGIEGIHLTMFHGLANMGYESNDLGYPALMNTYRSVYQYIIRRNMWRRFTLSGSNHTTMTAFSGKPYAWDDVKNDCWFRLPQLGDAELAKLTGIASFQMDAQPKTTYRLYKVSKSDEKLVLSKYVSEPNEKDVELNNLIALHTESAAVLRTATGHWLFVRPDLADVYVDMMRLSGKGADALPVYGYVLEGVRPLVVLRAPQEMPAPANELGYFLKASGQ
ncbi:MAG: hypothetical protein NTX50_23595 [Candidatus Sumerlaeota bacterium]|nr:hypothetical protein [Candidatus Sumerlaeota bacterium]